MLLNFSDRVIEQALVATADQLSIFRQYDTTQISLALRRPKEPPAFSERGITRTDLDFDKSLATLGLLRMVEPLDPNPHAAVPTLPQTDNTSDVLEITRVRYERDGLTDLRKQ